MVQNAQAAAREAADLKLRLFELSDASADAGAAADNSPRPLGNNRNTLSFPQGPRDSSP